MAWYWFLALIPLLLLWLGGAVLLYLDAAATPGRGGYARWRVIAAALPWPAGKLMRLVREVRWRRS